MELFFWSLSLCFFVSSQSIVGGSDRRALTGCGRLSFFERPRQQLNGVNNGLVNEIKGPSFLYTLRKGLFFPTVSDWLYRVIPGICLFFPFSLCVEVFFHLSELNGGHNEALLMKGATQRPPSDRSSGFSVSIPRIQLAGGPCESEGLA